MKWPVRYKLVGLLTLGTMINYIDRVNISVAALDNMRTTGWGIVNLFALIQHHRISFE